MKLAKYRVDYAPFFTTLFEHKTFQFAPEYVWFKRSAIELAQLDEDPETTITNRWNGKQVTW